MIYRIDGGSPSQTGKLDTSRASGKAGTSNAPSQIEAPSTGMSKADAPLLASARSAVNSSDGIDRAKVDAIKTAIRNGEYVVDAKRLAAAFIDMEMVSVR